MACTKIISDAERKIILGMSLLMCLFYFADVASFWIREYNATVGQVELTKMEIANGVKTETSFTFRCNVSRTDVEPIILLQFFANPLVFLVLLFSKRFWAYFLAFFWNFLLFLAFYSWAYQSLKSVRGYPSDDVYQPAFGDMLLMHSTEFEHLAFLTVGISVLLNVFFLIRFVVGKFSGKIGLA